MRWPVRREPWVRMRIAVGSPTTRKMRVARAWPSWAESSYWAGLSERPVTVRRRWTLPLRVPEEGSRVRVNWFLTESGDEPVALTSQRRSSEGTRVLRPSSSCAVTSNSTRSRLSLAVGR